MTHVVEYARSNSSRCSCCHETIYPRSLLIGQQVQDVQNGNVPYLATRWYHFACFSRQDWARVDVSTLHGLRSLQTSDQARSHCPSRPRLLTRILFREVF